jgi:hypothetical protein
MGRRVPRLDDRIESFVMSYWDTDLREDDTSLFAREDLRGRGLYDAVRHFLLDVILRDAVTPDEWGDLVNVRTDTQNDVRADALGFWEWLFDGEPLPGFRGPRGPLGPPQT